MLTATIWGIIAASSLTIGAILGLITPWPPRLIGVDKAPATQEWCSSWGAILDGIPEQTVLGVGMGAGNDVSIALLIAICLANIPGIRRFSLRHEISRRPHPTNHGQLRCDLTKLAPGLGSCLPGKGPHASGWVRRTPINATSNTHEAMTIVSAIGSAVAPSPMPVNGATTAARPN